MITCPLGSYFLPWDGMATKCLQDLSCLYEKLFQKTRERGPKQHSWVLQFPYMSLYVFYYTACILSIRGHPGLTRLPAYQEALQTLLSWDKSKKILKVANLQMLLWLERPENSMRLAHSIENFSLSVWQLQATANSIYSGRCQASISSRQHH